MRFPDWVKKQPRGALKEIERKYGVAYMTLMRARRGEAVSFQIAQKLTDATAGVVSIEELCDPKRRKKAAVG